jgi:hypothetical protein
MSKGSSIPLAPKKNVSIATKIRLLGHGITTFEGCAELFFRYMLSARGT